MSFQTRYLVYILALHAVLVGLMIYVVRHVKPLPIRVEYVTIALQIIAALSLYIAYRVYRSFRQPSEYIASGIEAIQDKDFSVKFVTTGNEEVDKLIRVYNLMIEQLRAERTRQAEQQFFMDKLVEASPIPLIIFDFDHRIASVNPVAQRLLQLPVESLLGKTLEQIPHPLLQQLAYMPTDQAQPTRRTVLKLTGVQTYGAQFGQFIDRGFGRQFLFLEELTTEIIETEKKAYGKVIRMMAHEVNNSIGAVNSILTIAEPEVSDPDLRQAVRVAIDRNDRLNRFMRRFADVVRLPLPHLVLTDMQTLLRNLEQLMQPQAESRQVSLRLTVPETPVQWPVDVPQLEQVLVNVVKNALEACQSGETVEIQLSEQELTIRDNGKPIPNSVASQLFDPFFSTKPDGQGIGLTLTREILHNHGFSFSLKTQPDGWTVFGIKIAGAMNNGNTD